MSPVFTAMKMIGLMLLVETAERGLHQEEIQAATDSLVVVVDELLLTSPDMVVQNSSNFLIYTP